jgi:aryl-phospho-beta-D-glucosidase BglC (GH1 family)
MLIRTVLTAAAKRARKPWRWAGLCALGASALVFADPFAINARLGKGLNLGNWLEAPSEGAWGVYVEAKDFAVIADKGFESVRIPIRWSGAGRVATDSPYTVSPAFFERVDFAIDNALKNGLHAVINCHHYNELFSDPAAHQDRFLAIWRQVADRYRDYPDSLAFEILNEPHDQLTAEKWNNLLARALAIIREHNPDRAVVIGTAEWGGVGGLQKLRLPEDPNLILTVHYYEPFHFTHQGASWVEGANAWLGTTWGGTYFEKLAIVNDLAFVRDYARTRDLPVYVGEFGAYSAADMNARARWTAYCARLFERYDFSWSYWEYSSGFGAYDPNAHQWREPLVEALLSPDTTILALQPGATGPNLLQNGDFADGENHWLFGAWSGEAQGSVIDGEYRAAIADPGPEAWSIQLVQGGLLLHQGTYALTFDARAASARTIGAGVDNGADYTNYGALWNQPLSTVSQTYAVIAHVPADDSVGRVSFSLGKDSAGVVIDNVSLVRLDQTSIPKQARRRGARGGVVTSARLAVTGKAVRVGFYANAECSVRIIAYDMSGAKVWSSALSAASGRFTRRITLPSSFPAGDYCFTLLVDGERLASRTAPVY